MRQTQFPPASFALVLAMLASPASAVFYYVTDLGTLGGSSAKAYYVNDSGQVLGSAQTSTGDYHTFLYGGGSMQDLGRIGFTGFNNGADIIGTYKASGTQTHAVLYRGGNTGNSVDLGTLGGSNSSAYGINNLGQVVGDSWLAGNNSCHAFLYRSGMGDLGSLAGPGGNSTANAINDHGQIVGQTEVGTMGDTHAFLYDGTMHDLGTLGGSYSIANAVNNSGVAVGYSYVDLAFSGYHAFLYDSTMHDLGTLGGSYSEATAINDKGQVIGDSEVDRDMGTSSFFLYENGVMKDLQTLVNAAQWRLDGVEDINNSGQIVAYGVQLGVWQTRALLLTPLKKGDFNANGTVDDADYTVWADYYHRNPRDFDHPGYQPGQDPSGGYNDADYTNWADNYSSSIFNAAPEPASLLVLAVGAMGLIYRRRG